MPRPASRIQSSFMTSPSPPSPSKSTLVPMYLSQPLSRICIYRTSTTSPYPHHPPTPTPTLATLRTSLHPSHLCFCLVYPLNPEFRIRILLAACPPCVPAPALAPTSDSDLKRNDLDTTHALYTYIYISRHQQQPASSQCFCFCLSPLSPPACLHSALCIRSFVHLDLCLSFRVCRSLGSRIGVMGAGAGRGAGTGKGKGWR
ncbi:hypothetical protein DENSPDRAFT_55564 [Dentipellis sp. KUC8613]|nr:hypothetical protein DENSPDRAFT_55564 [Dentipellis sp. KUC8613]